MGRANSRDPFRDELTSASSPQALLAAIESREQTVPDQWEAHIQARIQARARVVMQTSFLSDDELAGAHLEQTQDIAETVSTALAAAGPDARVCALPEGPQTIPYVAA
jgi:lactate racemase